MLAYILYCQYVPSVGYSCFHPVLIPFMDTFVSKAGEDTHGSQRVQSDESAYKRGQAQVCCAVDHPLEFFSPFFLDTFFNGSRFQGLLYKCLLAALGGSARQNVRSGAKDLRDERGVSRGSQEYDTDERLVQDIFC